MKIKLLTVLALLSLLTAACSSEIIAPANMDSTVEEAAAKSNETATENNTETGGSEQIMPSLTPAAEPSKSYLKQRAGRYYLSSMVQGGVLMSTEKIAQMESYGMEMLLDLKEDGSGVMRVFGEEWAFTWDEKELTFEQETSGYFWSGYTGISFAKEAAAYLFTKEKASDVIEAQRAEKQARKSETAEKTEAAVETEETPDLPEEAEEEKQSSDSGEKQTVTARFIGADWVKLSGSDQPGLCIWYEYTNGTDETISPYFLEAQITQNGSTIAEGEVTLSEEEKIPENEFRSTEVLPGGTNRSIHLFPADQAGGKIEYIIRTDDKEILKMELDPGNLPGRPDEVFLPEPVLDLDYLDRIPAKGVYNELYELSILTAEVVEQDKNAAAEESAGDEKRYLRVKFEFKNGSDEAVSPYLVLYLRAVQDGISLNPARSSEEDPDLDLIFKDVDPGKSSEFYQEWQLLTDSPVAVEAYDWFSRETVLGRPFEVE